MDEIRQILKEVEEMHPYRIPGIRESYDKYAEGWTDAVNETESRLPVVPDTNVGNNSEFPTSSTLQHTCNQLATDCIDRQAAIDILYDFAGCIVDTPNGDYQKAYQAYRHRLEILPSAQPEPHYDEWCDDCKEYNKERHCCPRWNRVIRQALKDAQPEPHEGYWIPHEGIDGDIQYECSKCGVLWQFNYGTPEDNEAYFCPKCGAKMKGEQDAGK